MTTKAQRAPRNLDTAGRRLWQSVVADYELDARELATLAAACKQADQNAQLEALLEAQGLVTEGSNGQPRLSAVVTEVRQGRLALGRLLDGLTLPDVGNPRLSRNQSRKATKRWAG